LPGETVAISTTIVRIMKKTLRCWPRIAGTRAYQQVHYGILGSR
jgi:hypothetical protein